MENGKTLLILLFFVLPARFCYCMTGNVISLAQHDGLIEFAKSEHRLSNNIQSLLLKDLSFFELV